MTKISKLLASLIHEIELAQSYINTQEEYAAVKKTLIKAHSEIILKQITDLIKTL